MFDADELTELTQLAGKLASVDERLLVEDDLLAGVDAIEATRRLLDAAEGALLGELDARGTTEIVDGMRTHQWLARTSGCSPAAARARVRLASTLRCELPATDRAVRSGRLCIDRARVMASAINDRIADEFRQMEDALIDASETMTFEAWSRHVSLVAVLLDQDGPEPADDITNNKLALKGGVDGTRIGGQLVGDLAITARHAIEHTADELYHQYVRDREATDGELQIPTRSTLLALALAELCRRGLMVDANGTASRPKVEATLVINADVPDVVYVDGVPLRKGTPTALMCDLSVWVIVMNSLGVPLDMGREIRTANTEQRRALKCRDGGCVFPGCAIRPEHCDAHHVAHWHRDLGTTNVRHMAFLCRHHHGVIHRRGWDIHIGDDGWTWITTPDGRALWGQQHGTTRSGAPPPG